MIADHIRSSAFLVVDGVLPDREGRGYVLRRIIRRALRHGHQLGIEEPFFHQLVTPLSSVMSEAYPELANAEERIQRVLLDEEHKFGDTLQRGMELLNESFGRMSNSILDGEVVFKLYDTFGFPVDLTADVCREKNVTLDLERFEQLMEEQRSRARSSGQFQSDSADDVVIDGVLEFTGYDTLSGRSVISQLFKRTESGLIEADVLENGEQGGMVLDSTAFYGEAGGQIGDIGTITEDGSSFDVSNVTRVNEQFLHHGAVSSGRFESGSRVNYQVDRLKRQDIARNHSATHLLHASAQRGAWPSCAAERFTCRCGQAAFRLLSRRTYDGSAKTAS